MAAVCLMVIGMTMMAPVSLYFDLKEEKSESKKN